MPFRQLSSDAQLKKGDLVLLKYDARAAGAYVSRLAASFVAQWNTERPFHLGEFVLVGNPVYNPADYTLNILVRVEGTPLLLILQVLAPIIAIVIGVALLRGAFQVFIQDTGEAVKQVSGGVAAIGTGVGAIGAGVGAAAEKAGTGLGVGFALAGAFLGLIALAALESKGVRIK